MKTSSIITIFSLAIIFVISILSIMEGNINPLSFFSDSYEFELKNSLEGAGESKVEVLKDKPEVRLKKWNGEVDMGVSYANVKGKAEKDLFEDKVIWKNLENTKEEVHAYPIQARAGMEDGGFEIEVVLNEKPTTNRFDFQIDGAEDLDFLYQPPLNEEYPNRGCSETECVYENHTTYRPENVVGSYAVYHKTKKDYIVDETNYGTGKVYHIYRPKAIDAEGKEQWAELHYENGILSVTVPQEFLDKAVYPVKVDPTFGYTIFGGSNDCGNTSVNHYLQLNALSPAGSNTMNYITIGAGNCASGTGKFGLYSESGDAPNSRLAYDASTFAITTNQFNTNSVDYNYSLTASTQYWVAQEAVTGDIGVMWDTGGTKDIEYDTAGTLPATVSPVAEISTTAKPSAYVTYTSDNAHVNIRGGGASVQTPTYVQGNIAQNESADNTAEVSFLSNVTAGNVIAVAVGWLSTTATLNSVTDTCGTSYTIVGNPTTGSTGRMAMAYGVIGTSGSCTVTATLSATLYSDIVVHEVSGVDTSSPLDNNQYALNYQSDPGTGTDGVTSGNISTTQNGDYIFGVALSEAAESVTYTPGTNYNGRQLITLNSFVMRSEDRIQSSSGSIAATFTSSISWADTITGVMAFKPASSPPINPYVKIRGGGGASVKFR